MILKTFEEVGTLNVGIRGEFQEVGIQKLTLLKNFRKIRILC